MKHFDLAACVGYLFNHFLLGGVLVTIGLTAAGVAGGLVLGMGIALMRMSPNPALTGFARFYIWFFRGTPLLIQLVVIYTGLPQLGIKFGVITSALIGLILNEAAYLAEIVRSGFLAVPAGQARGRLGAGPAEIGDAAADHLAAGVSPDDPAARQLHQLAAEGDIARLCYFGRGNHAPKRHADAGALSDSRSLCGSHRLLPDPDLALGHGPAPAGEAFPARLDRGRAGQGHGQGHPAHHGSFALGRQ